MKYYNVFFLILGFIFLSSCEGIIGGKGFVLIEGTNTPIENVCIILFVNDKPTDTTFSDFNGYFEMDLLVGCVPKCPQGKMTFAKDGYELEIIVFDYDFYKIHDRNNLKVLMIPN